jgi:hypothetical protein
MIQWSERPPSLDSDEQQMIAVFTFGQPKGLVLTVLVLLYDRSLTASSGRSTRTEDVRALHSS